MTPPRQTFTLQFPERGILTILPGYYLFEGGSVVLKVQFQASFLLTTHSGPLLWIINVYIIPVYIAILLHLFCIVLYF